MTQREDLQIAYDYLIDTIIAIHSDEINFCNTLQRLANIASDIYGKELLSDFDFNDYKPTFRILGDDNSCISFDEIMQKAIENDTQEKEEEIIKDVDSLLNDKEFNNTLNKDDVIRLAKHFVQWTYKNGLK